MRPLAVFDSVSEIARLLLSAPGDHVRGELARLEGLARSDARAAAALAFARGSLALRETDLTSAKRELTAAADAFESLGDGQAAAVARARSEIAVARIGPRSVAGEVIARLRALEEQHADDDLAFVVAATAMGSVHAAAGDASGALGAFSAALARSTKLLGERVHVLNSLGTLYAALGVHGAAEHALEHALELARRLGDVESQAIAHGQLGAIALARGALDRARTHLGAQELLASKLGDRLGRARSLTYLAEVALDAGQAEAARRIASEARAVALSATPPLTGFAAFADRIAIRARRELGEVMEPRELEDVRSRFEAEGRAIGVALIDADLAALAEKGADAGAVLPSVPDAATRALRAFAELGLIGRSAELLMRASNGDRHEASIAALAETIPHLAEAHEVSLAYDAPRTLAELGARKLAARKNLARLAALEGASSLVIAAVVADVDPSPSRAAVVGRIGRAAIWAWAGDASDAAVDEEIARAGDGARAAVLRSEATRIAQIPFAGELSARVVGVDLLALVVKTAALRAGEVRR